MSGASSAQPLVAFVPGTVLCLEPGADDRWRLVWIVRPGLATHDA